MPRKRGRPRHRGPREPSGRKRRQARDKPHPDQKLQVAMQRVKRYGIPLEVAMTELCGSAWGILLARQHISESQRDAGEQMSRLYAAFQRALHSPDSLAVYGSGRTVLDSEENDVRTARAVDLFLRSLDQLTQREAAAWFFAHRQLFADLVYADLQTALTRLAKHFGVGG